MMQSMLGLHFSGASSPSSQCGSGITPSYQTRLPGRNVTSFMAPIFKCHTKLVKITANASQDENNPATADLQLHGDSLLNHSKAPQLPVQARKGQDEESVLKSILNLAVPAVGAVLSDPIMSLIDTGCVGQVSSIQLAALGPNTSIFNFIFQWEGDTYLFLVNLESTQVDIVFSSIAITNSLIFTFLGSATCNLLASVSMQASSVEEQKKQQHQIAAKVALGDRREVIVGVFAKEYTNKASQVFNHALFLAVSFGIVVCISMEAFAPQLLAVMGTGKEYLEPALVYLRVRALSAPAVLILIVGQGACLGRQDANIPLRINSMAAVFNLIGDITFTLFLGWGVAGAAWATLISQCVAVALLVRELTRKSTQPSEDESNLLQALPLKVGWYGLPTLETLGPFLTLAGPLILRCALGMMVYTLTTKGAAEFGTLSIAAHQVALQVFWTLSYFPESLSIAAQSLVARNVKANPKRAQDLARTLLGFAMGLGIVLMGIVASVHYLGASSLTSDPNVRQLVQSVTLQSMLCELLCAVVLVIEGTAIASGDFAYLPKMQLMNLGGVLLALWLTFRNNWGLGGIWWCLVLYFGFRAVYHSLYIAFHWKTHVLGSGLPSTPEEELQAFVAS